MNEPTVKAYLNPDTGKMEYKSIGSPVKALDGNRVSGYLVRFTSADDTDLHGEYFDKSTNFWMKEHSPIGKPILLDHAFDPKFKSVPVGIIDFAKEDEIGIWIEGKLKDRAEYEDMLRGWKDRKYIDIEDGMIAKAASGIEKAVKQFFSTGKAQWSSGALPQSVEVDKDTGHIQSWAFIEGTGVYTPAEPDGTEIKIKSFLELLSQQTDSPTGREGHTGDKGDNGASADNEPAQANVHNVKTSTPKTGAKTKMNIKTLKNRYRQTVRQELDAMVEQELAAIVEQIAAEVGADVAPDDAEAIAEAVTTDIENAVEATADDDAMMMVDDDNKALEDEEQRKAARGVVQKHFYNAAFKQAYAHFGNRKAEVEKVKADAQAKARLEYQKAQPAVSKLPAFSGGNGHNGIDNRAGMGGITEHSRFKHWTAEDFSFALSLRQMTNGSAHQVKFYPDEKVMREFADKATKAHEKGEIILTSQGIKSINAIKANELDHSTQSGYGDEWVFTAWADNVWDKPRLDNVVVPLIEQIEMPSNPYEYPIESTDPTVFATAETTAENQLSRADSNAAIADSKIATAKVQFNAKKHALRVNISAELEEDGIARLMPKFREQAQRAILDAHDRVVLVGDTSTSGNINLDGGTPTTQAYISYDGLVHQALVTATTNALDASGATPTLAHIRTIRSYLGNAQGYNPNNLAIVTDFPTYMKLLSLDEVMTVDKYGSNATVLSGELGKIDGIPVFVSAELALADSDGKITDGGNVANRGRLLMFYRPDWFVGYRRRVAQHVTYLPYADSWELVMTVRHALTARSYSAAGAQQSTDDSVALLYNIGV